MNDNNWNAIVPIHRSEAVLLAYARKRLENLKQQLAAQREEEQKRMEQVLSVQRQEDEKLANIRIKQELDKLKAEFDILLKKRVGILFSHFYCIYVRLSSFFPSIYPSVLHSFRHLFIRLFYHF